MTTLASLSTADRLAVSGVLLLVVLTLCAVWVVSGLPLRVPVHWTFGPDGGLVVDHWMARETVRLVALGVGASSVAVAGLVAVLVRTLGN